MKKHVPQHTLPRRPGLALWVCASSLASLASLLPASQALAQIPTEGLSLWLKGDSLSALANNAALSSWSDSSGNDLHAVAIAGNEPSVLSNALNGHSVVHFDDASHAANQGDFLDSPLNLDGNFSSFSLFTVLRSSTTGLRDTVVQQLDDNAEGIGRTLLYLQDNPAGVLKVWSFASETSLQSAEPYIPGGWSVLGVVKDEAQLKNSLYRFNQEDGSRRPLADSVASAGFWRIGDNKPRTAGFQGEIAEVIVYNRALSPEERQTVSSYLSSRFNLPVPPTPQNLVRNGSFELGDPVPPNEVDGLDVNYISRGGEVEFAEWVFRSGAGIDNDGTFPGDNGPFFVGNSTLPNGVRSGFMQGNDCYILQFVDGLIPGSVYRLSFFEGGRANFGNAPSLGVFIDSQPLIPSHPLDQDGNYEKQVAYLVPDFNLVELRFQVTGGSGDITALVDHVVLEPVPNPLPVVATLPGSNINFGSGDLNGTVLPFSLATTAYFEWGATPELGNKTSEISLDFSNTPLSISHTLSDLVLNQTVYYRAVAQNANGAAVGETLSFTPVFDCIQLSPGFVLTGVGSQTLREVTVSVPAELLAAQSATVTLTSLDPSVAIPMGANELGQLTLTFSQGGASSQSVPVVPLATGSTTFTASNEQNVCVEGSTMVNVNNGFGLNEILFRDNFDNAEGWDLDFNVGSPRQIGTAAPRIRYIEAADTSAGTSSDDITRIEGGLLTFDSLGFIWASPDYNFVNGGEFSIEFDVHPGSNNLFGDSDNWTAIVFGATTQGAFVNASNGVGILFRNNGHYQVFNGAQEIFASSEPSPIGQPIHVRIETVTANFQGNSPASVALYIEGNQVRLDRNAAGLELIRPNGFSGNYITFEAIGDGLIHTIDNLEVEAQTCISLLPTFLEGIVGSEAPSLSLKVPAELRQSASTQVTLVNSNPDVVDLFGSIDGVLTLEIPQGGAPLPALFVDYLRAGTATIQIMNDSGVCIGDPVVIQVRSTFVINPSFENNSHPTFPGYGPIESWPGTGGLGINDGPPFGDNGQIPDRSQIALMQGAARIGQLIPGLTPGQDYWLQFYYNVRNCCGADPIRNLVVWLGGVELAVLENILPVGGANPYYFANLPFTASESELLLEFQSSAQGDGTVVLDGVSIVARSSDNIIIQNPSFEASGRRLAFPGYIQPAQIAGWITEGGYGVNLSGAGPFADNGSNTDQDNVLFLQGISSTRQDLAGFTPGQQYRLSYAYNARGGNTPQLNVTLGDWVSQTLNVSPVGGVEPYHIANHYFTPNAETATLRFAQVAEGDNTILLDNIVIVPDNTPPPVRLTIEQVNATQVLLSWPVTGETYRLRSTGALGTGWSDVTNPVSQNQGRNETTVNSSGETQYFQLVRP